ncbi:ABC transporter ATP-binding protein [Rossellomorea sp. BNER]|uniref:ABC transporter ATP-binding protein n=1 Tax=Rossellomorea sp. BNER TaxID=2962031 RepID=UPI003AF2A1CE|nr:ABC transporter ATP-binding protein/permease [Rossellomorea sp. BNER]
MAIAWFLMLVELTVELLHPLFMARIIDEGILKGDLDSVLFWGGIMVGMSFIAFFSGITNSFFAAHVSQGFGYDVRSRLFNKIQTFSFANLNKIPTSSLITRMTNDVTQIQNTVFMSLRIMLRAPLLVIGATVMALFVNVHLALMLILVIPFLWIFLIIIFKKGWGKFKTVQQKLDSVNEVIRENLTGIRLIRVFLRKNFEIDRFKQSNQKLKNNTTKALRLMEVTLPILLFVMNLSIIFVLWFGSIEVNSGGAKVGEVVAIINYATRITSVFSIFSFIILNFSRAKASSHRIIEVLETDVDLQDSEDAQNSLRIQKGEIEFKNVSFTYPNHDEHILKDVNFKLNQGETMAIMGATGSGKSSLFQLIPRLYDTSIGDLLIDDVNVKSYKMKNLRDDIGYVPQEALLFTGTIKENIAWGKEKATSEEIIQAAKDAQIHRTISELPNGYDTKIGQRGINLSGGQKQRISIARALVRKPKILLLDDCTSALDLQTEAKLLKCLKNYSCTTILITQKISTAIESNSILLLDNGKIIGQGDHNRLLNSSILYQKIFQSQFGKETVNHEKAYE